MRVNLKMLSLCLLLPACAVQQENGSAVQFEQPFILSDQNWRMSQHQGTCVLRAGELKITLQNQDGKLVQEVATVNHLSPGDEYKVLIGSHVYATKEQFFNQRQSQEIITHFLDAPLAYTEWRKFTMGVNTKYRSVNNKLQLEGFSQGYNACTVYVRGRK